MGIAGAVWLGRNSTRCPPEIDARVVAPDSAWEAAVFHYECGFGLKGTTNISIGPAGAELATPANLFVAMDSLGMDFLLGKAKRPAVEVTWEGSDAVLVRYPTSAQVITSQDAVHGIRVRYEIRE